MIEPDPLPTPEPSAIRQLSGSDPAGRPILVVLAKRRYRFTSGGVEALPEEAVLLEEPLFSEDDLLMERDSDLFPYKPTTDVVVRGHVHASGAPVRRLEAGLSIAGHGTRVAVFGDRRAELSASGKVSFTDPALFESLPLTWRRAFGGRDVNAERKHGYPWPGIFEDFLPPDSADPVHSSPFRYPRNPAGTGYLFETESLRGEPLTLPNFEDPSDLLVPGRLPVHTPEDWPRLPTPAGFGWVSYDWFPRTSFLGVLPSFAEGSSFREVERGHLNQEALDPFAQSTEKAFRLTNGAAPALQLPLLTGGEPVELQHLSPQAPKLNLRLPKPPKLKVDGRKGKLAAAGPAVIHTLEFEPDEGLLTVTWRGAAKALRFYLPNELPGMPFEVRWQD